jgi:DNA repair exonuclease SbcCD ATPase subunit
VDHIFVGGDIFHTKTSGISPEYIEFLTWWLTEMAKVATVHLTLGNHDGNLVNLTRQDAVSPVVAALDNERVKLYKKSGTYEFHPGYAWCVYSLFDEEGWKDVAPLSGCVNIACYHGPVRGSVTEVGWELEDGLKLDFFDAYKYIFLGDIHKAQHLALRKGSDGEEKPYCSYPGTPIQQNYAEDLEHGYLLWSISSEDDWKVETRKLPNPKPYVTIQWKGSLEQVSKETKKYPDGSRYRIRSSESLGQKEFSEISDFLKAQKSATEVTFKSDFVVDKTVVKAGGSTLQKADLRNPEVLLKLIKDYHGASQTTEEEWSSVSDQVKSYLSTVTSQDDTVRSSKWSLRYLSFDNMFSYGPKNVINFDKLPGIVGIFGQNRIGKSSIIGTLMYSLFNTTDRGPIKNIHVCNVRKQYCSSKALINHNGLDYLIERQTTKTENKRGVVTASTALNLFRINENGDADDLAGEQRNDTEKVIRSLIGTNDDFLMTSLSAQGETNSFISQGSTRRRSILSRFLDLDVFDKMHELASKDLTILKAQLRNYPDRDWSNCLTEADSSLKEAEKTIEEAATKIKEKQDKLTSLQHELAKHKDFTPVSTRDLEKCEQDLKRTKRDLSDRDASIAALMSEIEDNEKKLVSIQQLKTEHDVSQLKERHELYKKLQGSLAVLTHVYEKEETALNQHKKSLKILDEVPCGDEYSSCKFIKDAHLSKTKLSSQEEKTKLARAELTKASESLAGLDGDEIVGRLAKMEKLIELESKLKLNNSKKEVELVKLRSSQESLSTELASLTKKLALLEEAHKNNENSEVSLLKSNISNISGELDSVLSAKVEAATRKGRLTAVLEKLKEEKSSRDEIMKKMKVSEMVTSAFSKKGVPLIVTKSQLPVINAEISKILQGIVDFTVELENDETTDSSEIYINYGDSRRIIELCSGMEKTISSLAIRVAMINVSSLPKSDVFIIDEGFGTLDDSSVEACNRLLVALKKYFKTILVITHVDGVKDVVDHILEITKEEKDSRVRFGESHED